MINDISTKYNSKHVTLHTCVGMPIVDVHGHLVGYISSPHIQGMKLNTCSHFRTLSIMAKAPS